MIYWPFLYIVACVTGDSDRILSGLDISKNTIITSN